MRSGVFKNNWKSWFAVIVTILYAVGTLVPYINGKAVSLDTTSTVLTVAALLSIIAYFFVPDGKDEIKRWLFPAGFGVLSFLQLGSPIISLYNIIVLRLSLMHIWVSLLLCGLYFVGTVLCLLGSLFDFKKIHLMKYGSIMSILALLSILAVDFIRVGGFEYYSSVPDGILILSLIAISRYFSVMLFYGGMLLLSTNKKPG
jgi:hypothetical protein